MDTEKMYAERLGRYQSAIAMEPVDRIPVAPGTNYFAEVYAGYTNQEILYDSEKRLAAEAAFARDFPDVDVQGTTRIWGPLFDAVGLKSYKLPGRDMPAGVQYQYIEKEYMKAEEYGLIIDSPLEFLLDVYLPRVLNDFSTRGSGRSYMAFLKGGIAYMMMGEAMRQKAAVLEKEYGLPLAVYGRVRSPFDVLADCLRGLNGIMLDIRRQPELVGKACRALVPHMVNFALAAGDPQRRYPILLPLHRGSFLSPRLFDLLYWPSLKDLLERLIENGFIVRVYLEGDWSSHWSHFLELPGSKIILDLDKPDDIYSIKEEIGRHQCIAGGMPDSLLILGTPGEVFDKAKDLCLKVGGDGGYIISGGCGLPYNTRPENLQAMISAVLKYGIYDSGSRPAPRPCRRFTSDIDSGCIYTPWEVKLAELGSVEGCEEIIKKNWEMIEARAASWLWIWTF